MNTPDRSLLSKFSATIQPIFVVLFIVEFVRGALLVTYLPAYGIERLQVSAEMVGLSISIHYLIDSLAKCIVGALLDRFSSRLIVFSGLVLCLTGMGIMAQAHSVWFLLVSTGLLGLGGSPVWLVCIIRAGEKNRAEMMGRLYMVWLTGLGLGPVVINFIMDINDMAAFYTMVGLLAVGCLLSLQSGRGEQVPVISLSLREQGRELWERIHSMGFLLPGMILQTMAGGLLVPVLSHFASVRMGLSHSELSLVMISGGACAVSMLIPMGRLTDSHGGRWFLAGGFGIFAVTIFGLTYVRGFLEAEVMSVILGLSYAALLPAWNALLAAHVPDEAKGTGWGLVSTIEGLGMIVGPLLGGWLASHFGEILPFWTCAIIFIAISAIYFSSPEIKTHPGRVQSLSRDAKESNGGLDNH